ncbi:senescence-associated carboxylesterase 101-like isoform X2 [Corylus avellana]|uniref:senescence-associated carboxylesterase 101-like isoform X2 n=1 Tax=Corylus avellana TaxID=13451 RepID=UPI00286C4633|nr:senescence-associated carboxylesterase 101-like isoform X2 [Corylus avellana]
MNRSDSPLFSSGLELGSFVVTSNVLHHSWAAISELYGEIHEPPSWASPVRFRTFQQPNCTIIAFVTWPPCTKEHLQGQGGGDLVSSSALKETFPLFEFLSTKTNPRFSINKPAIDLFASVRGVLDFLKSQISTKPLIIAGHFVGGSVASLFTLWLLDKINLATTKRPLCITFGSPLVGDDGLQEAILQYPAWNSCFLHVVSDRDPVPRVLISPHNIPSAPQSASASPTKEYKPFGTFLLCSQLGCACLENPESVLELLMANYSEGPGNQVLEFFDYKNIVQQLKGNVICKDSTAVLDEWIAQPLQAGIITQLAAIGLGRPQQLQQQSIDMNKLITKTQEQEREWLFRRREAYDSKVLNEMKVNMAQLEWYKKFSEDEKIGYYDMFKNPYVSRNNTVERFKKSLTCYWIDMVDEKEKMPQRKGAAFATRFLFSGTNYRRMVEPLDIAEYYRDGETDYIAKGRTKHYKLLKQWLDEDESSASRPNNPKKQNLKGGLTEDSCFWAYVEEALISVNALSNGQYSSNDMDKHKRSLIQFDDYVWGMLKNYAVSPEIFLEKSSFMKWWKEYSEIIRKGIMGPSHTSPFTEFMQNRQYGQYAPGCM